MYGWVLRGKTSVLSPSLFVFPSARDFPANHRAVGESGGRDEQKSIRPFQKKMNKKCLRNHVWTTPRHRRHPVKFRRL